MIRIIQFTALANNNFLRFGKDFEQNKTIKYNYYIIKNTLLNNNFIE